MNAPLTPPPDEAEFGRRLTEALGHRAQSPVDAEHLLRGAQVTAARIRQRRAATVVAAGVLLVAGVPTGMLAFRSQNNAQVTSAAAPAAEADAGRGATPTGSVSVDVEGTPGSLTGPGTGTSVVTPSGTGATGSPASGLAVPLARTAVGAVVVPQLALLAVTDLPSGTGTVAQDTANELPAPPPPATATCGRALTGPVAAQGSRAVTLQESSSGWLVISGIRVYAKDGADRYLAAASGLPCATTLPVGDQAVVTSRSVPDSAGRTESVALVRRGQVVIEVRVLVPAGDAASGSAELLRLARTATDRLDNSGLAGTAAADPSLN